MQQEKITFMPLGAGSEVGRSCMYLKYSNTHLLFDIGIHPAYTGIAALPFLDLIDLTLIDALFVTHFHLDHAGALPYLTERTNFRGKVYMTHPTKAILKYLLNDYTRLVNASSELDFYTENDLKNCYDKIIPIDYHQEVVVKDFRISALNAGHVLGAAMFLMKIKRNILLYTGDYSTEEDRHLKPAEPPGKVGVLISESTYGVQCHLPREEREKRFTFAIKEILLRGGKVLLPVFALGRAQELLLILEEFWEKHREIQHIPIYYASALAKRCIGIYQTYSVSNKRVSFNFKYISNITHYEDSKKPCVVMASPGMLQSGLSRDLFEKWCEDKRNGVIIPGYCVNGTLAKEIMNEPSEIESANGTRLKLNCSVDFISFSAHVDYLQNSKFIKECDPLYLFLVHGEMNEMQRLKNALKRENIFCLKNGESHEIEIVKEKNVKIKDVAIGEVFEGIIRGDGEDFEIVKRNKCKELEIIQRINISYDLIFKYFVTENLNKSNPLNTNNFSTNIIKKQNEVINENIITQQIHDTNTYEDVIIGNEFYGEKNIKVFEVKQNELNTKNNNFINRENKHKNEFSKDNAENEKKYLSTTISTNDLELNKNKINVFNEDESHEINNKNEINDLKDFKNKDNLLLDKSKPREINYIVNNSNLFKNEDNLPIDELLSFEINTDLNNFDVDNNIDSKINCISQPCEINTEIINLDINKNINDTNNVKSETNEINAHTNILNETIKSEPFGIMNELETNNLNSNILNNEIKTLNSTFNIDLNNEDAYENSRKYNNLINNEFNANNIINDIEIPIETESNETDDINTISDYNTNNTTKNCATEINTTKNCATEINPTKKCATEINPTKINPRNTNSTYINPTIINTTNINPIIINPRNINTTNDDQDNFAKDNIVNEFINLSNAEIQIEIQKIPFNAKYSLIKNTLLEYFDNINEENGQIIIEGIKINIQEKEVQIEWKSSYVNDLLATCIIRNIQNIGKTIESFKLSKLNKKDTLIKILNNHYNHVEKQNDKIIVKDNHEIVIIENDKIIGEGNLREKINEI
ncbi:endoribonuclease ysh1, partial [Conglomerata obtusa]